MLQRVRALCHFGKLNRLPERSKTPAVVCECHRIDMLRTHSEGGSTQSILQTFRSNTTGFLRACAIGACAIAWDKPPERACLCCTGYGIQASQPLLHPRAFTLSSLEVPPSLMVSAAAALLWASPCTCSCRHNTRLPCAAPAQCDHSIRLQRGCNHL